MSELRANIEPLRDEHLPAVAELLAARHAVDRKRESELPARFEDPAEVLPRLQDVKAKGTGVVALDGAKIVGYLVAALEAHSDGRYAVVPLEGHASVGAERQDVYREMYAAAAPDWLRHGYFTHIVDLPAADLDTIEAWFSLAFGRTMVFVSKPVEAAGLSLPPDVDIRRAGREDLAVFEKLMLGLGRYNTGSAILNPFLPPFGRDEELTKRLEQALDDPQSSFWLGYEREQPVGLMIYTAPQDSAAMMTPERCIYLWIAYLEPEAREHGLGSAMLAHTQEWARSQGYSRCTLSYFSGNLLGARFWLSKGFRPLRYRLARRNDERIAWANDWE